jgi:hypothetical protein
MKHMVTRLKDTSKEDLSVMFLEHSDWLYTGKLSDEANLRKLAETLKSEYSYSYPDALRVASEILLYELSSRYLKGV